MANPNEDDRMQKILRWCWCIHKAKLMASREQLSREQRYNLLMWARLHAAHVEELVRISRNPATALIFFLVSIWHSLGWKT